MIDLSELRQAEDGDNARWQLLLRVTLLFGEERAAANRDEIDLAAAAIERVRRMRPSEFAGLDPEERAE